MARKLEFCQIDVSVRSALAAELLPNERKGLYFYTFSDGTAYVGKSVDLLRRHAEHLDEYKHREDFKGVVLERAYFLPLAADTDDKELDCLETEAIRQAEAAGYRLKNIQKVNLPGGTGDTVFVLAEGVTRRLPWNRADRSDELAPAVLGEPTTAQRRRYERFMARPWAEPLLDLAACYLHESTAETANTAGIYWTANAYPARNDKPVLCVTCGLLETLVVYEYDDDVCGYLNFKRPENDGRLTPILVWKRADYGYRAAEGVVTCEFNGLEELGSWFEDDRVLNWSYRLNIELFRRCKNPMGGKGNPLLMGELIERMKRP